MNWQNILKLADPIEDIVNKILRWVEGQSSFLHQVTIHPDYKQELASLSEPINAMLEDLEEIEVRFRKPDIKNDI